MIAVPPSGKKSIVLAGNANDCWDGPAITGVLEAIAAAPSGSLLVADYEIAPAVVAQAVDAARAAGLRIVLDPAPASWPNRAFPWSASSWGTAAACSRPGACSRMSRPRR